MCYTDKVEDDHGRKEGICMAIISQEFETLVTGHGTQNCDMKQLLEKSREISRTWENVIVKNEEKVNFSLDQDLRFHFRTEQDEKREADITQFAFSQLCTRIGVPGKYIDKCYKFGKTDLAMQNFRAWADEAKGNMLVRVNDGVVRAVLSDSYAPFDSYKVLRTLKYTANMKRFQPTQVFLSEDKLVVRFVDFTPLPVKDGSPLYVGFAVSSSDVGRGALSIKMFIYRSVCTNGLLISSGNGTLYKQSHVGEKMTESKMQVFQRAFNNIDIITGEVVETITQNRKRALKDFEMQILVEKAKRELKLSKEKSQLFEALVGAYEPTRWGIVNSVTELAQQFSLDRRIELEEWAGNLFTAKIA